MWMLRVASGIGTWLLAVISILAALAAIAAQVGCVVVEKGAVQVGPDSWPRLTETAAASSQPTAPQDTGSNDPFLDDFVRRHWQ